MNRLEQLFEQVLWSSRLVVIAAVIASMVAAFAMFYVATVDVVYLLAHVAHYADPGLTGAARATLRAATVTHMVEVVDGYLFATIMLIFALGLYELFVSRIDIAERSEFGERVLLIKSLDDLKNRLAKVVLLILVVKYFEHALDMHFDSALSLLYLAIGIALIAAAIYLGHQRKGQDAPH